MAPYIAGYILIYASLLIGGVIISTAALKFLGLGINLPTPEWGRLINGGQSYVATSSWHVATVPGIAIVLVVVAFNALGDAIRDAIDPEADVDKSEAATARGSA
jgi:peptide/nickel transport system permease protein